MSEKKKPDENENSRSDEEGKSKELLPDKSNSSPQHSVKKNQSEGDKKRIIRFKLPDMKTSEDSFTSALSNDPKDSSIVMKDSKVMKTYIPAPLPRNHPRTFTSLLCLGETDLEWNFMPDPICLPSTSSSKQLFEVLRNSPTPSDADLSLIRATYTRQLDAVKEAIDKGADVNTFRDRQTPLMVATDFGDYNLVRYLLSVPNINPDFQNVFGQTPLIIAVRNAFDDVVQLLLNHNADVNISDNMGRTALHCALFQQRPHMVKLLLAFGADYEKMDVFGEGSMYMASVKKPSVECLRVLLRVGASPEYVNQFGLNLLSRAIMNYTNFNIIETLVRYGADINSVDLHSRKSPLHYTAIVNEARVAKFLLSHGADANLKTCYNFTPFDEAILHKSLEVAEILFPLTTNASIKALISLRSQKL